MQMMEWERGGARRGRGEGEEGVKEEEEKGGMRRR